MEVPPVQPSSDSGLIVVDPNHKIKDESNEVIEKSTSGESIQFDLGEIFDPVTKSTIHLKGTIPLIGSYVKPDPSLIELMESFLTDYLTEKLEIPWREDQLQGEFSYVREAVKMIAAFNSLENIEMEATLGATFFSICFLYTDDFLHKIASFNTEQSAADVSNRIFETVIDIICGRFKNLDEVARVSLIPALDPVFQMVFTGAEYMQKANSDFRNMCEYFCKAFKSDWKATVLMKQTELIDACSDETYKLLRGKDVAARTTIEIGLLLHGVRLDKNIRSHPVLKLLIQVTGITAGLVNDLIGVRRELLNRESSNLIVRVMRRDKISLQTAFNELACLVKAQMADIALLFQKLKQDLPEDESVKAVLMVIQNFLNGHVHYYDCNQRYCGVRISSVSVQE